MLNLRILFLLPILSLGQEIYVRSELQRPAPNGEVLATDRMDRKGREILSPPVLRNAYTSFHVTLEAPPGTPVSVYIGLNPEDAMKATLYQEKHLPGGEPQQLEQVKLPFSAKIPEEGALNFLLDLWVAPGAKVQRVKVEPQMWIPDRWIVYPMEVRVLDAVVPKHDYSLVKLPEPAARVDHILYSRIRNMVCGTPGPAIVGKPAIPTVLSLLDRNVAQDMAFPRTQVVSGILAATGITSREEWCKRVESGFLETLPTEWYLRVRDFLYRVAVN